MDFLFRPCVVHMTLAVLILSPFFLIRTRKPSKSALHLRISLLQVDETSNASRQRTPLQVFAWRLSAARFRVPVPTPRAIEGGSQPHPPVAVVFVGALHAFRVPVVRRSVLRNVLLPLRTAGYPTHTFFHVDEPRVLRGAVLEPFLPATVTRAQGGACPPRDVCPPGKARVWPASMLCHMAEVWPVVESAEEAMERPFGWVYRLRPDVAYLRPLPLPLHLDGTMLHVNTYMPNVTARAHAYIRGVVGARRGRLLVRGMGKDVAFVPRRLAPLLFRSVDGLGDCGLRDLNASLTQRVVMAYWLARNAVPVQSHDLFFVPVLERKGLDCERVWNIGARKEDALARVSECKRVKKEWLPEILRHV